MTEPLSESLTDASTIGLRARTMSGGLMGGASAVITQVILMVTTVVLTRLLLPDDLGVVAAAMLVLNLLDLFAQVGVAPVLVRRPTIDERRISTTFWVTCALGLFVAAACTALSPLVANLVDEPRAAGVLAAMSLLSTLSFVRAVPAALLQRRLRYSVLYLSSTAAVVAYAAITITLAAATDLGPWSIVVGRLAMAAIDAAICWSASGFRPRRVFALADLREDLGFSTAFWANGLTLYVAKNADYWVVGHIAGAGALGFYYVAYVLPNILRQRLTWIMGDVVYTAFARIQDDRVRLRRAYLDSVELVACLAFPALCGVAVLADPVVDLFFGDRWSAAAAPMRILAVAAAVDAPGSMANALLFATGRASGNLIVSAWRAAVLVVLLVVTAATTDGLVPIAWAVLASTALAAVVWQRQAVRELALPLGVVLKAMLPFAFAAGGMTVAVGAVEAAFDESLASAVVLAVGFVTGVLTYVALVALVARPTLRRLAGDVRGLVRRAGRPAPTA